MCRDHGVGALICQRRTFSVIYKLCLWNYVSCATSSPSPRSGISREPPRASTSPSRRSPSRSAGSSRRSVWPWCERTTRRVTVTEAGWAAGGPRAADPGRGRRRRPPSCRRSPGCSTGHVMVGTMHTMGPIDVSLALAVFHERHPGVELTVREESSEEMAEMLRDRRARPGVLVGDRADGEPRPAPAPARTPRSSWSILPHEHPLAGHRAVRMAELAQEQFISYREGARLRELLEFAGRTAPGSSRRSRSSQTRASGSAGWSRDRWA